MFFHASYLILLPGMALMMWAQFHIRNTYQKYVSISSSLGMTGAQVADTILQRMGVQDVGRVLNLWKRVIINKCKS